MGYSSLILLIGIPSSTISMVLRITNLSFVNDINVNPWILFIFVYENITLDFKYYNKWIFFNNDTIFLPLGNI